MVADSNDPARAAALELPLPVVLVGAGERAFDVSAVARLHPEELVVRAVLEPDAGRREALIQRLELTESEGFARLDVAHPAWPLDALHLIAAPLEHVVDDVATLVDHGVDLAFLPPLGATPATLARLDALAARSRGLFVFVNERRASSFHRTLHEIVQSGELGHLGSILFRRDVAATRTAHRMLRGAFASERADTRAFVQEIVEPDLDALFHLLGAEPDWSVTHGDRTSFSAACAPDGATDRCDAPCPAASICPFDARVRYPAGQRAWPFTTGTIELDGSPYGRCVYRHAVEVADHLVVTMGVGSIQAVYVLNLAAASSSTWCELTGTRAALRALEERQEILVRPIGKGDKRKVTFDERTPPLVELARSWRFERAYRRPSGVAFETSFHTMVRDLVASAFPPDVDSSD